MGACKSVPCGRGGAVPCGNAQRIHVVIVGAGFAGASLAKHFEKLQKDPRENTPPFAVTLVSTQDYFDVNYRTFRSLVDGDTAAQQVIKLRDMFSETRLLHGKCTKVEAGFITVTIMPKKNSNGDNEAALDEVELPYDVLVLCTGSRYAHGSVDFIKGASQASTLEGRVMQLRDRALAIAKADNFNIIGGGPSSIEMAAELLTHYPEKKVALVSRGQILKNLNHESRAKIASFFMVHKDNIHVFEETKRDVAVKSIKAAPNQFVFTGLVPNTDFLKDCKLVQLDADGYVKVKEGIYQVAPPQELSVVASGTEGGGEGEGQIGNDEEGQIGNDEEEQRQLGEASSANIFCFGDIAKPNVMEGDWKSGEKTSKLAIHVASNIIAHVKGHELHQKKREPGGATLSLGPQDGVGSYGKFNMATPLVVSTRSRDLGVEKVRKFFLSSR